MRKPIPEAGQIWRLKSSPKIVDVVLSNVGARGIQGNCYGKTVEYTWPEFARNSFMWGRDLEAGAVTIGSRWMDAEGKVWTVGKVAWDYNYAIASATSGATKKPLLTTMDGMLPLPDWYREWSAPRGGMTSVHAIATEDGYANINPIAQSVGSAFNGIREFHEYWSSVICECGAIHCDEPIWVSRHRMHNHRIGNWALANPPRRALEMGQRKGAPYEAYKIEIAAKVERREWLTKKECL